MSVDLLRAIEQAAVRGWPALEQADVDGWTWRHASGGSLRANSVAALDWRGADVERSIEACERLYRARRAACVVTVSDVSEPSDLDARLEARGYRRGDQHVTMARPVSVNPTSTPDCVAAPRPTDAWMRTYLTGLSEDRRGVARRLIANLPPQARFVSYAPGGLPEQVVVSTGLTVADGRLASVQCMATDPEQRRRGGAARVLQQIDFLAAADGATHLYLQTGGDNAAAQGLYTKVGFEIVGRYHTRTKRFD